MSQSSKFNKITVDTSTTDYRKDKLSGTTLGAKGGRDVEGGNTPGSLDFDTNYDPRPQVFGRSFYDLETSLNTQSIAFFQNLIKDLGKMSRRRIMTDPGINQTDRTLIGSMYFFVYEPEGKKTLPYYDRFPLIIFMKQVKGGFHGLNLHYLNYKERFKLLVEIMDLYGGIEDYYGQTGKNKKKQLGSQNPYTAFIEEEGKYFTDSARIKNLTYNRIKDKEKFEYYKPCYKHYKTARVKSRFARVQMADWPLATLLPVEAFIGAPKQKIFVKSRNIAKYS